VPPLQSHKRDTKATALYKSYIHQNIENKLIVHSPMELFKMNKFKNVPPKTETHLSQVRHSSVSPARNITDTQQMQSPNVQE